MTTTWSESSTASETEWLTNNTVVRVECQSWRSSRRSTSLVSSSRAENGSSMSKSGRLRDEGPRDSNTLSHPTRQLGGPAVEDVAETERSKYFARVPGRFAVGPPRQSG